MPAGGSVMKIVRTRLPLPAAFVAVIVALNVPTATGVPDIKPVAGLMLSPGGSDTALHDEGAFVAPG
jgi:hypothetical protein